MIIIYYYYATSEVIIANPDAGFKEQLQLRHAFANINQRSCQSPGNPFEARLCIFRQWIAGSCQSRLFMKIALAS